MYVLGGMRMGTKQVQREKRKADPYLDRRSGEDRRQVYQLNFFANGGTERRTPVERRNTVERRSGCVKVSKWSSVCVDAIAKIHDRR